MNREPLTTADTVKTLAVFAAVTAPFLIAYVRKPLRPRHSSGGVRAGTRRGFWADPPGVARPPRVRAGRPITRSGRR